MTLAQIYNTYHSRYAVSPEHIAIVDKTINFGKDAEVIRGGVVVKCQQIEYTRPRNLLANRTEDPDILGATRYKKLQGVASYELPLPDADTKECWEDLSRYHRSVKNAVDF